MSPYDISSLLGPGNKPSRRAIFQVIAASLAEGGVAAMGDLLRMCIEEAFYNKLSRGGFIEKSFPTRHPR